MKNINLTPSSPKSAKGLWGNKSFILVSLSLLMLLSFICFSRLISPHNQWQGKFIAQIGSLFNIEKPKKTKKISVSQKSSGLRKTFELQLKEQEPVENIDRVKIEKEAPISEETTGGIAGEIDDIEVKEIETLLKVDNEILAGGMEEKPILAKANNKITAVGTEKESVLIKEVSKKEGGDKEKEKQMDEPSKTISGFYIQICSCVIKENADKIFRKLSDQGYSPFMEEIVRDVKMHNIYVDSFTKKSEAVGLLECLKKDGFDSVLLTSSYGRYKIRITSCFYMESAKKVIKKLNRLRYETSIRKEFIPTRMYSVLLGNFESLQEAEATSKDLIKMGYPPPILKLNPQT